MRGRVASDIGVLVDMLTYCRPYQSITERAFCKRFIEPLADVTRDEYGNYHVVRGTDSRVLWSCHTDTVHRSPGFQRVKNHRGRLSLGRPRDGILRNCLGADDTAGVFILRDMVIEGIPGHYVFHAGEEIGCVGSRALAKGYAIELQAFQYAIALDRAGTGDVVTHQNGRRCCSDAFVESMAECLESVGSYTGAHGVYTDTAEYTDLIPECTNLSVGYEHQHSAREYLNSAHVMALRDALLAFDESRLVAERDPSAEDTDEWDDAPYWRSWKDTKLADIANDGLDEDYYATLSEDDRKFLAYLKSR